jgi:glycosyltransferase involved in cell wall biosynthesis
LVGVKIICCARSLVVGGSAAKNYALSLGKNERHVFTAINCANDLKLNQDFNDKKKTYRPGKYTFLYLSRIIPRKGLDILLKAFSLLRGERSDVFLLIAGDGPFRIFCENLTKSLQIPDVSFIGPVNQNSVIDYYQQADVFVLPSYYHEGLEEPWGLVINEAMSMNLPVITTTAVGAAYDIVIDDYNGFIAHENDVKSLYRVLDKILGMDLNRMGLNSRILFEKKNNFVHMANGFTSAIKHAKLK